MATSETLPTNGVSLRTCAVLGFDDTEARLPNSSDVLLEPTDLSTKTPGSLGMGQLEANFRMELTDLGPMPQPVKGMELGGGANTNPGSGMKYMMVTLTATGQVRPAVTGAEKAVASVESARVHFVVGPSQQ